MAKAKWMWLAVGCALLVAHGSALAAGAAAAPDVDANYPRKAGEIKATMQLLAPTGTTAEKYIARLKQYRYICGIAYEDIKWNEGQAELAQAAAEINAKLNKLTHNPERPAGMSDADYEKGKKGAGQSNLFMGVTGAVQCVDGWMDDSDDSNIDRVGHRRWIINPKMGTSGFGTSGKYAAMYAFDGSRAKVPDWDYVAYPARGYMPTELFGGRHAWSVSLNTSKYNGKIAKDNIKVTVQPVTPLLTNDGPELKIGYFNVETSGFGTGPAIIFRPEEVKLAHDRRYKVTISGLEPKAGAAPLEYLVHFVNLSQLADGPETRAAFESFLQQRLDAVKAMPDEIDRMEGYLELSENKLVAQAGPTVAATLKSSLSELMKKPAIRKEYDALLRYRSVADAEKKVGKKKENLLQAATAYRDLAAQYKETRAGQKAAADFERLKKEYQ